MDTMLQNGDFARGPGGLLRPIQGVLELTQRAMIRLTVRKGAFPLDDTLGSELYRLRDVKKPHWQETALLYAREALSPLPQVEVEGVSVAYSYENQAILLDYRLKIDDAIQTVVMTV